MMPVVRLSDATFAELRAISTWLTTKTPSETIDMLIREKLDALGLEPDSDDEHEAPADGPPMLYQTAPGLSFTRLISAKVAGKAIEKNSWANLLLEMIRALKSKGLSVEKLVAELQVPAKARDYTDEGFRYIHALGISLQGQSAQDAWKEIDRIANKWKIPVEAQFQWRQNSKALHPGRLGILKSGLR